MKNTGNDLARPKSLKGGGDSASMGDFAALGTAPFFCTRLAERGIQVPTDIQSRVIPRLLNGENLLFRAPTGTGKTFAYLVPLFQSFLAEPEQDPAILICAPTYELCSQIKGEADFLLKGFASGGSPAGGSKASLIIGSAGMDRQIETLKKEKPAVVVGNPGRLLQLARIGKLKLGHIRALVLDEGDRLTAEELREETESLVRFLPAERQSAACSATCSSKNRQRLLSLLGSPCSSEETGGIIPGIEHWAVFSPDRKKPETLRSFLAAAKPKKALIFTARAEQAGMTASRLQHHHFSAGCIQGGMDKKNRKAAMDGFRKGRLSLLVSTDLACRGLDIEGISCVIALDVPRDEELYLHRSGRTGRAGRRGIMVSIGDEEEMHRLARIEKKLGIIVYPKELYRGRIFPAGE